MKRLSGILILATAAMVWTLSGRAAEVTGEMKRWHTVTVTFTGPVASETGSPNPFRDYRLDVAFTHEGSGTCYVVPGYFAADGNAANSGATAGNRWRAHFSPDATGAWTYVASFRTGTDVAVALGDAGVPTAFDGERGSFTVGETDKSGADFRGKGRLQEVGQHYLQHLGSKEYFVKAGAGSPENFLAYADFDNTPAGRKLLHHYAPHLGDWRTGDPTWKGGKGRAIIGALNYLASKKMNSLYFLTMNVGGDGDDVFPWTAKTERHRFDVSKLAQWEVVFDHMDKLGLHLHVVTQEQENDQLLDGGGLGLQRKLYYRELVARFGHHLGVTWNLGEETTNTDEQRSAFADYINAIDPYRHLIAVHTFPSDRTKVYTPMLAHPVIGGASLQLENTSIVHTETMKWVKKSAEAGCKWVVAVDELGHASAGVVPDAVDPAHRNVMHRVLWGGYMGGGAGVEWYFGYNYDHHDLTCEDWRSRENMWTLTQHAAQFFRDYLPLPLVANFNSITSSTTDYCFGKPGVAYAIFLPEGATTNITLPAGEAYRVEWFNPRSGGALVAGTVAKISGGAAASVGRPPSETSSDWVALLRRTEPDVVKPPPAGEGMAITRLMLVSAAGQLDLRPLVNGAVVDLSVDGLFLNIKADVSGTVGSVAFSLTGQSTKIENVAPYVMLGDDAGIYRKWTPAAGTYTLRATPYSKANRGGTAGETVEVTFTVTNSAPPPTEEPPPSEALAVTRLVLVDARSQRDIRPLVNGDTLRLGADGTALNVRAEVNGVAGSVRFAWDGATVRTENVAPYALAADDSGVFRSWMPTAGTHVLRAAPYSKANAQGTAGLPLQLRLHVEP